MSLIRLVKLRGDYGIGNAVSNGFGEQVLVVLLRLVGRLLRNVLMNRVRSLCR